ncbi:hypothetical protein ACFL35_13630 [Candidatus Riflebacteria bacterium]
MKIQCEKCGLYSESVSSYCRYCGTDWKSFSPENATELLTVIEEDELFPGLARDSFLALLVLLLFLLFAYIALDNYFQPAEQVELKLKRREEDKIQLSINKKQTGKEKFFSRIFNGNGKEKTSPFFIKKGKLTEIFLVFKGDTKIIVHLLHATSGLLEKTIFKKQGPSRAGSLFEVKRSDHYLFEVVASGSWELRLK